MTLLFTKNRNHVYFYEGSQNLGHYNYTIFPRRLATGYNENLFKHLLVVLSFAGCIVFFSKLTVKRLTLAKMYRSDIFNYNSAIPVLAHRLEHPVVHSNNAF